MITITDKIRNLPRPEPNFLIRTAFLKDDLSVGKSCKKAAKGWECRDCGSSSTLNATTATSISNASTQAAFDWAKCHLLAPRGICKSLETEEWDPRQVSMHDPLDPNKHRHVLYHYSLPNQTYAQVPCEKLEDCWNMSKCAFSATSQQLLTMFGYGEHAISLIKQAAALHPEYLQWVPDSDAACLLLGSNHGIVRHPRASS
jgi:hypothetical protein